MTFKGLFITAATFAGLVVATEAASAASPAYCALYSREYAIDTVQPNAAPAMLQSIQDQAYFRCLNMDLDPALPQTSAYLGETLPGAAMAKTSAATPSAGAPALTETAAIVPPLPRPAPAAPPKTIVTASAPKVAVPESTPMVTVESTPKATITTASAASTASTSSSPGYHPSGKPQGSDEWKAYCAKWFPNSWDPATGTILRVGASSREVCR